MIGPCSKCQERREHISQASSALVRGNLSEATEQVGKVVGLFRSDVQAFSAKLLERKSPWLR